MRGTLSPLGVPWPPVGIIPAYAGNTITPIGKKPIGVDHPRVCGEHSLRLLASKMFRGSSPRMRGTPDGPVVGDLIPGIIPAYAGNT